jgi:membrane protease YdiL (CAAX protease family)
MSYNLKIRSPWSQLALFLGLLGVSVILYSVIVSAIVLARAGLHGSRDMGALLTDPRMLPTLKLAQAFSSIIVFGVPSLLYARLTFRDRPLQQLGLRPADKSSYYLLGVILLLVAFPLEAWVGTLNKQIPLPSWMVNMERDNDKQIAAFLNASSNLDVLINLVVVAVLPAIFEELCFRGTLQRILIQIFRSPWAGILFSAGLFSAFHMQFEGFLPRMLLGILLGLTYWYSGSLWTTILAHLFFNGIQVLAVSYSPKFVNENPAVPWYAILISFVIVVGLLNRMRKQSVTSYTQVYLDPMSGRSEFDDFMSGRL